MKLLGLLFGIWLVAGCTTYAPQPRALAIGPAQPMCLFLCTSHTTSTDAESGSQQTATTSTTSSMSTALDVKKDEQK